MRLKLVSTLHKAIRPARTVARAARKIQKALSEAGTAKASITAEPVTDGEAPTRRPIRPLGQTIDLLRKLELPEAVAAPRKPVKKPVVRAPGGASFLLRDFTGPTGSRQYQLYIPKNRRKLAGLLVMLHGCTQTPEDFAAGTRMNEVAEEYGLLVAYPAQTRNANGYLCWNWFNPSDQIRGSGEPAVIAGITQALIKEFGIDGKQVFIAGLSAGGAMASTLAATYPELYAAVGIHSGLGHGTAGDLFTALAAMRGDRLRDVFPAQAGIGTRAIVFHGDDDRTVHASNAEHIVSAAKAGFATWTEEREYGESLDGVEYTRTILRDTKDTPIIEQWTLHEIGHAWSGGSPDGSHTEPRGPDASHEMVRFFLERPTVLRAGYELARPAPRLKGSPASIRGH